jgi:hypothetical protein
MWADSIKTQSPRRGGMTENALGQKNNRFPKKITKISKNFKKIAEYEKNKKLRKRK